MKGHPVVPTVHFVRQLRGLWRHIPQPIRAGLLVKLKALGAVPILPVIRKAPLGGIRHGPIILSGIFKQTHNRSGIPVLYASALRHAGFEVIEHDVSELINGAAPITSFDNVRGGVWITCCSPMETRIVFDRYPHLAAAALYRVSAWTWDLTHLPRNWHSFTQNFHELWAPSAFQAQAFRRSSVAVSIMPPPVDVWTAAGKVATDVVTFIHICDLCFGPDQQNPAAAIAAYILAFPEPDGVRLRLSISGVEACPWEYLKVNELIKYRPDILLINGNLNRDQRIRLIREADVFISLHRAESSDLALVEAMALSKPVIATAWGSIKDLIPSDLSIQLVPFLMKPISSDATSYKGLFWAEPDLEEAARRLQQLKLDPALRARLGERNQKIVADKSDIWMPANLMLKPFAQFACLINTDAQKAGVE